MYARGTGSKNTVNPNRQFKETSAEFQMQMQRRSVEKIRADIAKGFFVKGNTAVLEIAERKLAELEASLSQAEN